MSRIDAVCLDVDAIDNINYHIILQSAMMTTTLSNETLPAEESKHQEDTFWALSSNGMELDPELQAAQRTAKDPIPACYQEAESTPPIIIPNLLTKEQMDEILLQASVASWNHRSEQNLYPSFQFVGGPQIDSTPFCMDGRSRGSLHAQQRSLVCQDLAFYLVSHSRRNGVSARNGGNCTHSR